MVSVARHHEMLGRAIAAERWELAEFALRELDEDLEPLPSATPPEEARAPLADFARAFSQTQLAPIGAAVRAHDLTAARAAWSAASAACNQCHTTAGFGFLIVPQEAGAAIPAIIADARPDAAPSADATAEVTDAPAAVAVDAARPLPALNAACDDRVGCAHGLVCCTHGGIAMPFTHHGRCLTRRMCSTQPAAHPH